MALLLALILHQKYDLGLIPDTWNGSGVGHAAADEHLVLIKAARVFRENPLPRREDRKSEKAPLTSVRVPRQDQVNIIILQKLKIFGMVRKQDPIALPLAKAVKPREIGRRRFLEGAL